MTIFPLKTALAFFIFIPFIQFADSIEQSSAVPVYVQVLDINDRSLTLKDLPCGSPNQTFN